jgi:hypothetical protein
MLNFPMGSYYSEALVGAGILFCTQILFAPLKRHLLILKKASAPQVYSKSSFKATNSGVRYPRIRKMVKEGTAEADVSPVIGNSKARIQRSLKIRQLVLPNAAGGRNQGFKIRINRPRAVSYQPSAVSTKLLCKMQRSHG